VIPTGRIEDLNVPRDREGVFHSQAFEHNNRYEPEGELEHDELEHAAKLQDDRPVGHGFTRFTFGVANTQVVLQKRSENAMRREAPSSCWA